MSGVVIIGAGQGGFQAAASLRSEGYSGPVLLIGEEAGLPYQRPPLSKTYLKSGDEGALALRPAAFYETQNITLRTGLRADRIDRARQVVVCGDTEFPYDHLILATGTRNLRPPIPGIEHALDLRTLADAARLRGALDGVQRVGVIGGGFIGLEFAAVARSLGREVTVAEAAPRLMARAVSPAMSERFAAKHREMGTEIILGDGVTAIDAVGFTLSSGRRVNADLILLAAGVRPNTELAWEAGLEVANGILVNDQLLTSDPAISALGDCASFPDHRSHHLIRLESVQAAADHARLIAKRIVHGPSAPYHAVPWFWSDQADWKLQIAGLARPEDSAEILPDGSVIRLKGDIVTAVETVNNAKVHMMARKRMAGATPMTRESFAAPV
ncbi:FAD-dependent oxidoreductase [Donghicola sp. B5-SW-15]|uniref:FAD-dependent oxidoreductase n=1 Tax=Donghicola mangrovi TaxID=2729614 RepID=A0A850QFU1_9RHOB|nr:FAD-dependent oxidoreductase [Donghicola mangrovi]NVO24949.1 FAD-dependent oxidoreductase [Donghicola mangrovi]